MADELFELLKAVRDEPSFVAFARALQTDREAADAESPTLDGFQGKWANNSIAGFIEQGISWIEDSDFGSRPGPKPSNPWALFAAFLWAGRGYE